MRYQALHLCTHGLPLVPPASEIPSLGTSTRTSIQLGVEAGVIAEINSHIETFTSDFGNFTTILTGGDADFLIKKIKNGIFANADLNLIGLHRILTFNGLHEE
jgi:type III pantothenate kinase